MKNRKVKIVKVSQKVNLHWADRCKSDLRKRVGNGENTHRWLCLARLRLPGLRSDAGGEPKHCFHISLWKYDWHRWEIHPITKECLARLGPGIDQKQGEPTNPSERSLQILGKEGTNPKEGAYASYKSMYLTFTLSC